MSYFNNSFDTTRFVDVTSNNERARGKRTFCDTQTPGVYYSENTSGRVYRKIRRTTLIQDRVNNTRQELADNSTYCINPRVVQRTNMSPDYVLIPSQEGRMNLIQYAANTYEERPGLLSVGSNSSEPGITYITFPS